MALATAASGTQSATVTTEHTLNTSTTAAIYVLSVNLTTMVAGDVVELRLKTKTLTGDTAEEVVYAAYANSQGDNPIVQSVPVISMFSITATLKQTAGTSRNFPWALLTL